MTLEATGVWSIGKDGYIAYRRPINLRLHNPNMQKINHEDGLSVQGLLLADFALFSTRTHSVTRQPISYLITSVSESVSTLVNSDYVEADPQKYVTRHLATLILSAAPDEIENFTIDPVVDFIRQNY